MVVIVMLVSLAAGSPAAGGLPADPFQRCAVRALAGEFGPLEPWQRTAYARGLRQGVTAGARVWLTRYGPWEGRQGRVDSRGRRCTERTLAANVIPRGTYVWLANPCGMRQVLDCGARSNDARARRRGCAWWADLWVPRRTNVSSKVRVAVIR